MAKLIKGIDEKALEAIAHKIAGQITVDIDDKESVALFGTMADIFDEATKEDAIVAMEEMALWL